MSGHIERDARLDGKIYPLYVDLFLPSSVFPFSSRYYIYYDMIKCVYTKNKQWDGLKYIIHIFHLNYTIYCFMLVNY